MTQAMPSVSALTETHAPTKVCPQCRAVLFEDMNTCYGCLYEYDAVPPVEAEEPPLEPVEPLLEPLPWEASNSEQVCTQEAVAAMPFDEPVFDPVDDVGACSVLQEAEPAAPQIVPTVALQPLRMAPEPIFQVVEPSTSAHRFGIAFTWQGATVKLPLPAGGLRIGRAEDNHIVMSQESVSRKHMVLLPEETCVKAIDLGSRNPPLIEGKLLVGCASLKAGQKIELSGAQILIELLDQSAVGAYSE